MTANLLLYGTALGLFLGAGAHFLDRGLRAVGHPTRWIWLGAMGLTAGIPLTLPLLPQGVTSREAAGRVLPVEALFQRGLSALPVPSPGSGSFLASLDTSLLILWVTASGALLLLLAGAGHRLNRRSRKWPRGRVEGRDVLISDGLGPAVLGLFRQRIVLPAWALELDKGKLRLILLHEDEHRRAWDPVLLAAGTLLAILAPWNAPLWWIYRRLRLAVEGDCDQRVLRRGVGRQAYGRLLLEVAAGSGAFSPLAPALTEGGRSYLERRLGMMRDRVRKGSTRRAILGVAAGGLFLFLACETPTPPLEEAGAVELPAAGMGEDGQATVLAGDHQLFADKINVAGPVTITVDPTVGGGETGPLILIDDEVKGRGQEVIRGLEPEAIESIEVIKGAAAEAVWGPEAAAGVIKIYLKK